ncbi:MAG TPA: CoA-transferase [Acidimicrobiia bacterium]
MADKRVTEADVVGEIRDGMTLGIGGWGSRRKPMSLVRAIARSDVRDLTVVSYGGPDVGLLCAAGKVKKAVYAFCSLDSIALEPHFRRAREAGEVSALELDEGMFLLGLQAAAWRVPFLPTRVGLGSDVLARQDAIRTIVSPYRNELGEIEELVAAPALPVDVALIHMHRGDARGNGQYLNVDPYMDDLFAMAAKQTFMSVERVVPTDDLASNGPVQTMRISRLMTHGVVAAPYGAHFTECVPDYGRDEAFQRDYARTARDPDAWAAWKATYLDCGDHDAYLRAIGRRADGA